MDLYGLGDKGKAYISELSGGQKQRLALARTITLQPKILCMDEPTSALDPQLTSSIAKHLQELASQGYIILIATHDTVLLDILNCTIHLMQAGKIVESASSEAFKKNKTQFPQIAAFVAGT